MIKDIIDVDWGLAGEVIADSTVLQILLIIIAAILVQLAIGFIIDSLVGRVTRRHRYISKVDARKQAQTLKGVLRTMSAVIIWITAVVAILAQLKFNLATLAAGAGLFGIIFGFGAQSVIKDFVAGLFIIGENQYRVGDVVALTVSGSEVFGTVEDLTIRITRLRDLDGNLHIISNGSTQHVTNLSFKYANVNINVEVAYDTDIDKLEKVINDVGKSMQEDETWTKNIYEPIRFLRVDDFMDSGIQIKALGRVVPAEQWAVAGEFRRRLKVAFEKHGIEIPYPHVVIKQPELAAAKPALKTPRKKKQA